MRVDLVTIFPRLFESPLQEGLIRRARAVSYTHLTLPTTERV